jgi:hypothetical protein
LLRQAKIGSERYAMQRPEKFECTDDDNALNVGSQHTIMRFRVFLFYRPLVNRSLHIETITLMRPVDMLNEGLTIELGALNAKPRPAKVSALDASAADIPISRYPAVSAHNHGCTDLSTTKIHQPALGILRI